MNNDVPVKLCPGAVLFPEVYNPNIEETLEFVRRKYVMSAVCRTVGFIEFHDRAAVDLAY